jgi:hypothetical protein
MVELLLDETTVQFCFIQTSSSKHIKKPGAFAERGWWFSCTEMIEEGVIIGTLKHRGPSWKKSSLLLKP